MKLDTDKMRWNRDRLGLSLADVAEKAEVAEGTVLRAEHGEDIRPSSGRRIARAFGVALSELIPEKPGRVEELAATGKGEAPREAGPPRASREELVAQGVDATEHEVEEANNLIMAYWRLGQGEKAVAYVSHDDVDEARVWMLIHLVLDTPSIVTPEAAGIIRQGIREKLKA